MTFLQTIILGALEGFTEFLPISSTAHLLLTSRIFGLVDSDFLKSFTIVIQFGAILAVVVLYAGRFLKDWETNKRIIAAFVPTAAIGFGLYKIIKGFLFENTALILAALLIGGVLLIVFEIFYKKKPIRPIPLSELPYWRAVLIGAAQALAIIPGVSRAAVTIVGGMLLGVERKAIVEFSFLLAVPTMAAASGYDLLKNASQFSLGQFHLLLIGFTASFFFAIVSVRFLLNYIKNNSFTNFGIYRILLVIVALILLFRR